MGYLMKTGYGGVVAGCVGGYRRVAVVVSVAGDQNCLADGLARTERRSRLINWLGGVVHIADARALEALRLK